MLFLKEKNKINNVSVNNIVSIRRELLMDDVLIFEFNNFNISIKNFDKECDIEKYLDFFKHLEDKYDVIESSDFDREYIDYFDIEIDEGSKDE